MPRYRRTTPSGSLQHVITRFVNRERRIVNGDDRAEYLDRLGTAVGRSDWRLLSYSVMGTHVHWSALAGAMAFDRVVRGLHSGFAGWLNRRQGRLGPVFADRPKTITVDMAVAGRLIAYHHNNPRRAAVVQRAADSSWTSHRAYVGLEAPPSWLDVSLGLELAGFGDDATERLRFDQFVNAASGEPTDSLLDGGDLQEALRDARGLVGGPAEVGYPCLVGDELRYPVTSSQPRVAAPVSTVVAVVATHTGIPEQAICGRSRRPRMVAARRLAVLTALRLGKTFREIAVELDVSAEAASRLERSAGGGAREQARNIAEGLAGAADHGAVGVAWVRRAS